jgi:aspartate/methionine/tyrosine aminotransferase
VRIAHFKLERYFARYEFAARYQLSASDCETLAVAELLELADEASRALWHDLRLGYTESQGHPLLREEISGLYTQVSSDRVLVAAPEEAVFLLMHALLDPGDTIVVTTPAYQSLHEVARSLGCRVVPWPLDLTSAGWSLDLNRLAHCLPGARLLVLNFPHNPTGFLPREHELTAIVELARAHGIWVFSDEMYRLLELDEADRLPALVDLDERGISLAGLSKAFGLPGLRVGWLAVRAPELVRRLVALKDYTTICSSAPSEVLAIAALRARTSILDRNRAMVRSNLVAANTGFAAHADLVRWLPPRAGSVAFPLWLGPGRVPALCHRVRRELATLMVPGSLFGGWSEHFRVGLGRRDLPVVLAQFLALLARFGSDS